MSSIQLDKNSWAGQLVATLETNEKAIDKVIPNTHFQIKMDNLAEQIKEKFAPFVEFNQWLEENNQEDFYEKLGSYLIKLPLRSASNILSALYSVVSTAMYLSVHPLKGSHQLAKSIITLLHALTQPEVWPTIGAGSIGILAGHSLVMGNPLSLIGVAIGGALITAGISVDAVITAIQADDGKELHDLREKVKMHAQNLPDTLLVGFFTGMLIGGMRRATQKPAPKPAEPLREIKKPIEHIDPSERPVPIDTKDQFDKLAFEKVDNVAQYKLGDWSGHIETVSGLTLEEAKAMANSNPNVDFFFYMRQDAMYLEGINKSFFHGDAAFFSGEPHWGDAWCADGYVKV